MSDENQVAVEHLKNIFVPALKRRKEERVELDRASKKYWTGLQKHLPAELFTNMEADPENEGHQEAFFSALVDLINAKQKAMLNTAIFLAKKGVEL